MYGSCQFASIVYSQCEVAKMSDDLTPKQFKTYVWFMSLIASIVYTVSVK